MYVSPNGAVNNYEHKLLAADFNLTLTETQDKWGRPTHTWNKGTATIGEYVDSDKLVKSYYTACLLYTSLDCAEHQKQDAEQHSKNGVEGVGKERQPHASQDQQRGEEEIAGFCDFQQRTHRNCLQSDRIIIVATV